MQNIHALMTRRRFAHFAAALLGTAASAQAQIWDGGGTNDNWTTANNWNPNAVPANDGTANIAFRGSVRLTPIVPSPRAAQSISFISPAGSFNVSAAAGHNFILVGSGGITNNDNSLQTITCAISMGAAQTWKATNGDLSINSVDGQGFPLTIDGGFNTTIGRILGNGTSLTKSGAGMLTLTGDNSFSGLVTINAGILSIDNDARLGNGNNDVLINGGSLALIADLTTSRDITLAASGATINGTTHELRLDGGTLTVNSGSAAMQDGFIGFSPSTNAAATIDGTDSTWTMADSFAVGYQGQGTLSIQTGGYVQSGIAHIGSVSGSTGTVIVTGTDSAMTSAGFLGIGYSGTGTLNIEAGGNVSSDSSFVATDPGSIGQVNVTGADSLWHVNGAPVIGEDGDGALTIADGGTLTCQTAFIGRNPNGDGNATITGAGSEWINSGTFIVAGSGTATMTVEAGGNVENASYAQIGGNSGSIGAVTVTGAGSAWQNGGDLMVGFQGKGTLNILAGGAVSSSGGSIGNAIAPNDGAATVGAGSTWTNSAGLNVGDAGKGTLTIEAGGSVTDTLGVIGRLNSGNGTATVTGAGATWTNDNLAVGYLGGTGSLTVQNGGHVTCPNGSIGNSSGTGTATVTGAGSAWDISGAISIGFNGSGTLLLDQGASMTTFLVSHGFGSGSNATATITGANSSWTIGNDFQMCNGGATSTLNINGGTVTLGGNITDGGSGVSTLTLDGGTLNMQNHDIGSATPINNLNFRSGTLRNVAQINNGAGLTKTTAGTLILNTANAYGGPTAVNGGILHVSNTTGSATGLGSVTVASVATLRGAGIIKGPVQNNGAAAPGASAGTLTVQNSYAQTAGGSLNIEIGGTTPGTTYDRLVVTGVATLNGALNVTLINGFVPSLGQTFDVLTAGSISGFFSTLNTPSLPSPRGWQIQYLPGVIRLAIVGCEPCDVNCDGSVNIFDIQSFVDTLAPSPPPPCSVCAADTNEDGSVNIFDIQHFVECLGG